MAANKRAVKIMLSVRAKAAALVFAVFLVAFAAIPMARLQGLEFMPGDIGDSRLNNYFLENVFQFLGGGSRSLWHLGFFAPYPYVLGFSDNLFGASPIYLIARLVTGETDSAFQIWFLAGYAANFAAAFYAARRLGLGLPAACVAALIFSFALPTSAQTYHVQLHYRFGIPLSALYLLLFLEEGRVSRLAVSALWLAWQFYCGIYMGFFALLLLAGILVSFLLAGLVRDPSQLRRLPADLLLDWRQATPRSKALTVLGFAFSLLAMVVLIFPYFQVSRLYAVRRSWAEIELMLPRGPSYLMSDASWLWGRLSRQLPDVPMRHEHQMFVGIIPALLAAAGFFIVVTRARTQTGLAIAGSLVLMVILTLNVAGYSIWSYLYGLPLASAIRVLSRIDQVLLFPIGYLAGIAIDRLWRSRPAAKAAVGVLVVVLIAEAAMVSMPRSAKAEWRARMAVIDAVYPKGLPASSIVFIAQRGAPVTHEIDVMWAALRHRNLTLNGYSGLWPQGFSYQYGADCDEILRRVLSYGNFAKQPDPAAAYRALLNRIVPVGFPGCDPRQLSDLRQFTVSRREYTPDEFRQLSYGSARIEPHGGRSLVWLTIRNAGDAPISGISATDTPVRISWRFLRPDGSPVSGWETRRNLPFDIPAKGELVVPIEIDPSAAVAGGTLQFSLVQEGRFWIHDLGVAPLSIPWK